MPLGLVALAIGAFGIGLTEFVIMGLLPEVAADFAVTEATAGWLISGYALSVVVGALGITAATIRLPRKPVLLALVVLFVLGNALTALAPGYGVALLGRVIAALCHGAFFGIGAVVAAGLVAPEKKGRAIAVMFTGERARRAVRHLPRSAAGLALDLLGHRRDRGAGVHRHRGARAGRARRGGAGEPAS